MLSKTSLCPLRVFMDEGGIEEGKRERSERVSDEVSELRKASGALSYVFMMFVSLKFTYTVVKVFCTCYLVSINALPDWRGSLSLVFVVQ